MGSAVLGSRFLGVIRELLTVKYLGVSSLSDAFMSAYRVPNSLRKIFAEGALSSSLIPSLVHAKQHGKHENIHSFMLLALLFFESLVLVICAAGIYFSDGLMAFIAPGFSVEKVRQTASLFRILMPYIFFLSSSALFSSALQSVNHFFIPSITPMLMNIVFIASAFVCMKRQLPPEYLCYLILFGGLIQLIMHIGMYLKLKFSFAKIKPETWKEFYPVAVKFLFCMIGLGISEINLFVDTWFGSYLPEGSITLITYSTRFMGIPLGIFATSFSTILLPYMSKLSCYAPKRAGFFLLEAAKLVFLVAFPATILMAFFSVNLFETIFLSSKFSAAHVIEASSILNAYLVAIFAISLNKILMNMYYSFHVTWITAIISLFACIANAGLNYLFVAHLQATGIALATTVAAFVQTALLLTFLRPTLGIKLYIFPFFKFVAHYAWQLFAILTPTFIAYAIIHYSLTLLPTSISYYLLHTFFFWFWVGPLFGIAALLVFLTRHKFGIKLFLLD